ncbi:TIGR04222 domain-containing membrane protein [Saccharothrix sp. Mg75]|uniref:TIGR04222 domain-containing membrane protein n=1 Tax=Saccharothrix sp. Mg75 TaxID=3445357 RepID=UPI003EEF0CC7
MGFLWWCGAALVAAVVVGLRVKRVTGAAPSRVLSFEEIGYLGGGPVRAVEVAVSGLVADNRARVSGTVVSAVPGPAERPASALQGALLEGLRGPRDLDELVVSASTGGPVRRIGRRLVAEGLLVAPRRRLARALLALAPVALVALLVVVAGPGGWESVVALSVAGALAVLLLLGPPPVLTRWGARAFAGATAGLAPVDPAEVTARYGLARAAVVPSAPREGAARAETAVFDGERAEPIAPAETSQGPRPRRGRAVVVEPRRWQRRNGWLVAGGWFAGGWLAAQWLEGDDGGFLDGDHGGFGGFDA